MKIFISYSHEHMGHEKWVEKLAEELATSGYEII